MTDKQKYISAKIKKLREEGYKPSQASAIAYSMEKERHKKQQGGNVDIASINQGTGIQFEQNFANQYFRPDTQPVQQTTVVDYRNLPIQDITSIGQWSDRKVWRTQRPEWFLGKKEPIEGQDYTVVPYKQWQNYQTTPEYLTYTNTAMQQGGMQYPSPYEAYYPSIANNYVPQQFPKPAPITESDFTGTPFTTTSFTTDPRITGQQMGSPYQFSDEPIPGTYTPQPTQYNDITRINIPNLYTGVDLESSLAYAGQGFGSGNAWQAGLGTGLSVLKGARNFLQGYAGGRESERVRQDQYQKLFNPTINYQYAQQGGEITNAQMLTNQYLTDQVMPNVNAESGEYVRKYNTGDVKQVVGEKHIKNGKVGEGVDLRLDNGDKVLSNYTKIPAKDIKELKERYDLKLKKNATFADAQKAYDKKIGLQETTDELSKYIEKFGENSQTEDPTSKRLNDAVLSKQIEETKLKLEALKEPQSIVFENLFGMQEALGKKGNPGELLDKNGKVIEETAQQGDKYQQGGMIEQLAGQYGISVERAKELIAMQTGGEIQPQQPNTEQVAQYVAQALQGGADPNQILQQLVQNGIDQQTATQLIQQVMQQMQPQNTEQTPQPEVESSEQVMAQEGLIYDVNTGRNTYRTSPRVFQSATAGAYGEIDPQVALQNLYNNFPDIVADEFKKNIEIDKLGNVDFKKNLPLNKEQELVRNFQKKADSRMRASAKTIIDNPDNFTPTMVDESKRYLSDETFLEKTDNETDAAKAIRGFDSKLGNFTSGRYSLGLNLLTPEDLKSAQESGIKTYKQLKTSPLYKNLSETSKKRVDTLDTLVGSTDADYTLSEVNVPATPTTTDTIVLDQTKPDIETRNITKNVLPLFPDDLRLAPSSLSPIYKEQITLPRMDAVKLTTEPYLANAASQYQTDVARVQASGLSPQAQEAVLAQASVAGNIAANDAIARVEQANLQSQLTTDNFNLNQRAKEQITNAQFNQQYEQQVLQGLNNYENNLRAYYNEGNAQNRRNYQDVNNINLLNAQQSNYAYIPGVGVEFLNNQPTNLALPSLSTTMYDQMTPEQIDNYKKAQIEKQRVNNLLNYRQKLG